MAVLCRAMKGDEAITSFFPVGTVRTSGVERAREKMHVGSPPRVRDYSISFDLPPPTTHQLSHGAFDPHTVQPLHPVFRVDRYIGIASPYKSYNILDDVHYLLEIKQKFVNIS